MRSLKSHLVANLKGLFFKKYYSIEAAKTRVSQLAINFNIKDKSYHTDSLRALFLDGSSFVIGPFLDVVLTCIIWFVFLKNSQHNNFLIDIKE